MPFWSTAFRGLTVLRSLRVVEGPFLFDLVFYRITVFIEAASTLAQMAVLNRAVFGFLGAFTFANVTLSVLRVHDWPFLY
jgi:hypothetical protein